MMNNIIGNTPLVQMSNYFANEMYCKFEGSNFYGSAKDRAAQYVLNKLLRSGEINAKTEIIESSSGNMGVALAAVGRQFHLKVTIIIDEAISPINEFLIVSYGANVIKVSKKDENGSYLAVRLNTLKEYMNTHDNIYWFNQYGNDLVSEAYRETIGKEIIQDIPEVDYIFIAISSGGTINGISQAIKRHNKETQVIAVDCEGSRIFCSDTKKKRHFTGIGSSIVSDNVRKAVFDNYIITNEADGLEGLKLLLKENQIFAGASSGCVYAGAKAYLCKNKISHKKVVCVFHDRGERYYESIYKNISLV